MSSVLEQVEHRLLQILERNMPEKEKFYAEWPEIRESLLSVLTAQPSTAAETSSSSSLSSPSPPTSPPRPLRILFPGCCNSRLTEHLYDAGFHHITNIDLSKAFIYEMLERNRHLRPDMKWRVMSMIFMHKFEDEAFDTVLDYGRLDLLMAPQCGPMLASLYMFEVKRVLQKGGKFIRLTRGSNQALGSFFPEFRYGWRLSVHALPMSYSNFITVQTYMVIAEKENSLLLHEISLSFDPTSLPVTEHQVRGLLEAVKTENQIREEFSKSSDIFYTLEDLLLGAKGDLTELSPGQRIQFTMGEDGYSRFVYRAVLLDPRQQSASDPFLYHWRVLLVPKTRGHEWLFSSKDGQWFVAESTKASRLIMVLLDSSHTEVSPIEIQKDLSPLVKQLEPCKNASGSKIPCNTAGNGIKQHELIHQVTTSITGPIIVDEVVYEKDSDGSFLPTWATSEELLFRRLTFPSCQNLVQSQVLLRKEPVKDARKKEWKNRQSSKSKKRGNRRKNKSDATPIGDSSNGPTMDYDYLANDYHIGIISGFVLILSHLKMVASNGHPVRATIIGLGGGMLPMFLLGCLPLAQIEVVELDPVIPDLAREFFGFKEDEHLKVHVADGVQYVRDRGLPKAVTEMTGSCEDEDASCSAGSSVSCGSSIKPVEVGECSNRVDILIVDVDSFDSSSGMVCPAAKFVEENFLLSVKGFISEQGLFIINLLSRSAAKKALVISRMKKVFSHLYSFQIEKDVHEIIFAVNTKFDTDPQEAFRVLKKLLNLNNPATAQRIKGGVQNITILK